MVIIPAPPVCGQNWKWAAHEGPPGIEEIGNERIEGTQKTGQPQDYKGMNWRH